MNEENDPKKESEQDLSLESKESESVIVPPEGNDTKKENEISEEEALGERGHEKIEPEEGDVENDVSEELEESEELEDALKIYKKNLIEAALYASGEALSIEMLSAKLDIPKDEVDELVHDLQEIYEERSSSLIVAKIGDKFQMRIKSEYMEIVSQFAEGGGMAEKYLRTLTIIALKQPLLKSTLVKIRGTGAYEHVKYLEENFLVDSVKKGRTSELTTTDKFAEMFGLPKNVQEMKKIMVDQGLGLPEEAMEKNKEE